MKYFPLLLVFAGTLALGAQEVPEFTLTYHVNEESFVIAGFEDRNPYYLEEGEKVFPEKGGYWNTNGDFEELRKFAYLPPKYRLDKQHRTHKDRNNKEYYSVEIDRYETIPAVGSKNENQAYLVWDSKGYEDLVVLLSWLEDDSNYTTMTSIKGEDLHKLTLEDVRSFRVPDYAMNGYPLLFLMDPISLKLVPPKRNEGNLKSYLNRLAKAGSAQEFEEVWQTQGVQIKYDDEVTPLHMVAAYGRTDILKKCPDLESLSKVSDNRGQTPAHYAARNGRLEYFKLLEKPKVANGEASSQGYYPIHTAIINGHLEVSKWLVDSLNLKNKRRKDKPDTPLVLALNNRRHEIFDFLISEKATSPNLEESSIGGLMASVCQFGRIGMVEYMLKKRRGTKFKGSRYDVIDSAIKSGNPDVLELVLSRIKELDYVNANTEMNYLHVAALQNESNMILPLVEKGISVNAVTTNNVSPLYIAVTSGNLESTMELLKLGADPDITPEDKVSAIWAATYHGNRDEIQALLEAGATCELKPDFANTMVEYATLYDVPEVVQIAMDQCLGPDYYLYDEFPGIYVADYFSSEGVKKLLEEKGQTLDSVIAPTFVSAKQLDSPIKFLKRFRPSYPQSMMDKYGTINTKVWMIFSKRGDLILPKFDPPLPPDLTRHAREILKEWKIVPPVSEGVPVNVKGMFPLTFEKMVQKVEIHEVDTLDVGPKPTKTVAPIYPRSMRNKNVQSDVLLVFVVLEDGTTTDIKIAKMGSPAFGEAAVTALKKWKFEPGIKDGKPVQTRVRLPMSFSLRR